MQEGRKIETEKKTKKRVEKEKGRKIKWKP